jgi:archaeal flagellar protein FlaJ
VIIEVLVATITVRYPASRSEQKYFSRLPANVVEFMLIRLYAQLCVQLLHIVRRKDMENLLTMATDSIQKKPPTPSSSTSATSSKFKFAFPQKLDETVVYFTVLLYAISTGETLATDLVRTAGSASQYPYFSRIMSQIYTLGIKWQYGMAKAAEITANTVKFAEFKLFLMKLAQVLRLGEDLRIFLKHELNAVYASYAAEYERSMKSMDMMLEMYSTIMSTSSFMTASVMIMVMISGGGGNGSNTLVTVMVAILIGLAAFVFLLFMFFPKDRLIITRGNPAVEKLRKKSFIFLALSAGLAGGIIVSGVLPMELAVTVSAAPFFIMGLSARKVELQVRKIDDYYPAFVRHLGDVYSTVGSLGQSLRSVLRSDFGALNIHVKAMSNRVAMRTKIEDVFELFTKDTSSALVSAGNAVLAYSIIKGANMLEVGITLSEISSKFLEIRRKREQSSKALETNILIMHVLTLVVFGLMTKLVGIMNKFFSAGSNFGSNAFALSAIDPVVLNMLIIILAFALSGLNALVVKISQGGLFHTIWFNLAILLSISGVLIYATDQFIGQALGNVLDIGQNIGVASK